MFFEHGMTLKDLKAIVDQLVEAGAEDALVMVQANADGISDILVNGFEGCANEFAEGPKVFSLVSVEDRKQFQRCYGAEELTEKWK